MIEESLDDVIPASRRTHVYLMFHQWQGTLIRLGLTIALLLVALALASRFG